MEIVKENVAMLSNFERHLCDIIQLQSAMQNPQYNGLRIKLMATPTRKRCSLTLEKKKEIIKAAATNTNRTELAKQFGVPRTTLNGILAAKEKIEKAIEGGSSAKRYRMNPTQHNELEKAILLWFKQVRSQNIPVNGHLLQEKAKKLAKLLQIEGFSASNGWLEKFTQRHSISFKSVPGEAGPIDMTMLGDWQQLIFKETMKQFSPDDIFNVDETGLFWKLLPNKIPAFKGEQCTAGEKSKERITVLVGANMTGSEKLPLFVIGKSAKPRCFKNAKVPIDYIANTKAWMTGNAFETWLHNWDKKLKQVERRILLCIDNCSAHSLDIKLNNIIMRFLPPNTLAESQPMDQGVIQNLKAHYRRLLLRRKIDAIEAGETFSFNLLDALHLLRRAWEAVPDKVIHGSFYKASFITTEEPVEDLQNVDEELVGLWQDLGDMGELEEGTSLDDYILVDQKVQADGLLSLEEIAASMIEVFEDSSEEPEQNKEPEQPPVTNLEARKALNVLRQYIEKNIEDPVVLKMCDELDDLTAERRVKEMKKTS